MARNYPKTVKTLKSYSRDLHAQWRPWGGTSWTQEPHPLVVRAVDTVTYGPNLPDWRFRLMRGQDCTTSLSGVRNSSKASELHLQVDGSGPSQGFGRRADGFNPNLFFLSAPSAANDSIAEQIAAQRFLGDFLSKQRTWHGGATIAEFAETVKMLASPIQSLYGHTWEFIGRVGRLRRVFKRNPVKYGKLLGQLWLAYAFGIAPLVSDVNDAYAAVSRLANNLNEADTVEVFGQGSRWVEEYRYRETVPYTSYAQCEHVVLTNYHTRYVGKLRVRPPGPAAIAETFGVGFTDILPSVWEGIPWSWLVDYFVNVQEMLDSVKLAHADFAWVKRTVRNRRVHQVSGVWVNIAPVDVSFGIGGVAGGGQGYCQSATVVRGSVPAPRPGWQFRIPGMPRQFANVAALVLAIKGSKPKS